MPMASIFHKTKKIRGIRKSLSLLKGFSMKSYMGVSKNRETPQNGWFVMENLSRMDDLGVPLFLETPIYGSDILKTKTYDSFECII